MVANKLLSSMACAAIVASAQLAAPVRAGSIAFISLESGHSTIVQAAGLTRAAVGDARIAGLVAVGTSQVIINAKSAGHTTVTIWLADGARLDYEITVTQQESDDFARTIRSAIADPHVSITTVGRSIIISGKIDNGARASVVSALIDSFREAAKSSNVIIVNALSLASPFDDMRNALATMPGGAGLRIDGDPKGDLIVSGRAGTKAEAQNILENVRRLAGPYLTADGKLIDRIELTTTSQVAIKVYVLEIDQTGLKQLGLRLQGASNTAGALTYTDPQFPLVESPGGLGKALTIGAFFRTIALAPTIDAIVQTGHASVLSSPDLVTMPGEKATYLVGGEVPYIFSTGLGASSIVFKEYGVKLEITPSILGNGSVQTLVAPEVSDLDFSNGISLNGYIVPALKTSRISTDLVTQPGESIVMAGLLQRIEQRNIYKVPGLGDLPILGQLFRSTRYQSSQTDVIFVMTPEIITR